MQNRFIPRREVLEVIKILFMEEHQRLQLHPINEQNIIGNKLTVIEIELKKLIKGLKFIEPEKDIICMDALNSKKNKRVR